MKLTIAIPTDTESGWERYQTGIGGDAMTAIGETEEQFVIPFGSRAVAVEVLELLANAIRNGAAEKE
jgi:hypothetical protein